MIARSLVNVCKGDWGGTGTLDIHGDVVVVTV